MAQAALAGDAAKVLVVEDETLVAMFLVDLVEDFGFAVVGPAGDGLEALRLAENERPQIAIVDVSVAAAQDGLEIGAELSRRYGTRLILISGHGHIAELPEVKELRPVAVLKKPCLPSQIEEALMRAAGPRFSR